MCPAVWGTFAGPGCSARGRPSCRARASTSPGSASTVTAAAWAVCADWMQMSGPIPEGSPVVTTMRGSAAGMAARSSVVQVILDEGGILEFIQPVLDDLFGFAGEDRLISLLL